MTAFQPIPLGRPIPATPHAVSCSLPTMQAVHGYERKDPAVIRQLATGYPRFVVHPFAQQLAQHFRSAPELAGRTLWLTSSARMATALVVHLGRVASALGVTVPPAPFHAAGIHGVSHPDSPALAAAAKTYLQNCGGFLSAREAEDRLLALGLIPALFAEETFGGDAAAEVRRHLHRVLPAAGPDDLILASCGMNAIWAAFQAVAEIQAARGRTVWLQLGWLYLDTIAILQKFTATPADYVYIRDVTDLDALARLFAAHGAKIAGVVAEVPTNPLIQTPDLPALAALCRQHGARLIVDPSIVSVWNVDVLPHADIVATSLTKYTASDGDLVAGLCALNPAGPDAAALRAKVAAHAEAPYGRDLARLAVQIGQTDAVLARIHAGTARVAAFLAAHPAVKDVFWAHQSDGAAHYRRLARGADATGGMITFTLREIGSLARVYDRLRLPKGPSFGMKTTLICPFMYLAHYDLVTTPAGLAELAASKLDANLLRLCVGTEPPEAIIAALAEALG